LYGDFIPAKTRSEDDLFDLFGLNAIETNNLDIALSLAARGLAVCPQHDWGEGDGWKPISKFPERATTDLAQIRKWWSVGEENAIIVKLSEQGIAPHDLPPPSASAKIRRQSFFYYEWFG
jgi:hypothetical protein